MLIMIQILNDDDEYSVWRCFSIYCKMTDMGDNENSVPAEWNLICVIMMMFKIMVIL